MTATITKWTPIREFDSMERRMRRMLEAIGMAPALLPAADVYETADEVVVALDVPGFEEKELDVEVSDHMLRVTGTHKVTKEQSEKAFYLQERLEREFERCIELPAETDTTHVNALFKHGVLEVHAAKLDTTTAPTKVEIKSE